MRWVFFVLLASQVLATGATAQVVEPAPPPPEGRVLVTPTTGGLNAPSLAAAERDRLVARTGAERERETIPDEETLRSLELALVQAQRDAIDITAITALQWLGGLFIAAGVAGGVGASIVGNLVSVDGFDDGRTEWTSIAIGTGVGLSVVGLGVVMLGLAELDGNLHRCRELDARIERLLAARVSLSLSEAGPSVLWSGSF